MKSVFIIVLMMAGLSAQSEEIHFQKFTSLKDALAQSKKENKPILVDTWATWCGWCTYMDENIFSNSEVAEYFNANFIAIKVNADANVSSSFMSKYEISGLPALLILDENGAVLSRNVGAITEVDGFIEFGELAYYKLKPETSPWYKNEQAFEAGNRDYVFLQEYAFSLLQGDADVEKVLEINELYWENSPSTSLTDSTNFMMFYLFVSDFEDPRTAVFLEEKEELIALVGASVYYAKGIDLIQVNLDEAIELDDKKRHEEILAFTELAFLNQTEVDYDDLVESINEIWNDR